MKMDQRYTKLGKNTLYLMIGNFASKMLVFLLVPLYSSFMTTEEFGTADIFTTTITLIMPLLTLAVGEGVIRFSLDKQNDKKTIFSLAIYICLCGFILLFAFLFIGKYYINNNVYCVIFLLYYATYIINDVLQQFVQGLEHMGTFVACGVISTVVLCISNIVLVVGLRTGLYGYLFSLIISNLVSILFLVFKEHLWKNILPINKIDKKLSRELVTYCIPLIPNGINWWINNSLDKYMVLFYWGPGENGIYSMAYKIPSIIAVVSGILTVSLRISIVEDFGSSDSKKFIEDSYNKISSIYILICAFSLFFIESISKILFANDFYIAWKCAVFLIIAAIFQSMCSFVGIIYTSAKETKVILRTTLFGTCVNLFLNFVLIPTLGGIGAAVATLISYYSILIVRILIMKKTIGVSLNGIFAKNMLSYGLLFVEGVCICIGFKKSIFLRVIITLIICFFNYNQLLSVIKMIYSFIVKIIKRKI